VSVEPLLPGIGAPRHARRRVLTSKRAFVLEHAEITGAFLDDGRNAARTNP
jgi:hypothetical protein